MYIGKQNKAILLDDMRFPFFVYIKNSLFRKDHKMYNVLKV